MKRRPNRVAPEFPPPDPNEEVRSSQVRLKHGLWRRLKQIGEEQTPKKSMNDVIAFFLEWAVDDYEKARARKSKK